jgi:hypothetical protein
LAVCLDTDPYCISCRVPFINSRNALPGAENGKPPYATRLSMIFGALGACLGPVLGADIKLIPSSGDGGLDLNQAVWAGIGAAVAGTVGFAIGMVVFGKGSRS